jgi:hypothetical protein
MKTNEKMNVLCSNPFDLMSDWVHVADTTNKSKVWARRYDSALIYNVSETKPSFGSGGYPVLESILKLKGDTVKSWAMDKRQLLDIICEAGF